MMGPQVSTVIWSLVSKTVPEADIGKVHNVYNAASMVIILTYI